MHYRLTIPFVGAAVAETRRASERVGVTALGVVNSVMAALCGSVAGFLALLCAGFLLAIVSGIIGWPRTGLDIAPPGGFMHFHLAPGTTTVNYDTCKTFAGHQTCTRVTHTAIKSPDIGNLIDGLAMSIIVLPIAALVYGLTQAAACFLSLARRRWFEERTITHLRNFALGGLVFLVATPAAPPLARLISSVSILWLPRWAKVNPGNFNLDLAPLPTLLTGVYAIALAVITVVLAHARKVAEDHAQIV